MLCGLISVASALISCSIKECFILEPKYLPNGVCWQCDLPLIQWYVCVCVQVENIVDFTCQMLYWGIEIWKMFDFSLTNS